MEPFRFEGELSNQYWQFRPTYPKELLDYILKYCKEGEGFKPGLAVDVGCGTGLSTWPLASVFQRVIGVDPSNDQIAKAKNTYGDTHNIEFVTGVAEDLPFLADNSVDLMWAATTYHWLDKEHFCVEARRVLKPSGVLAAFGYRLTPYDNAAITDIYMNFQHNILGPYFDPRSRALQLSPEIYQDFPVPFRDYTRVHNFKLERKASLDSIIGITKTLSAFETFMARHPNAVKVFEEFKSALQEVFDKSVELEFQESVKYVKTKWPIVLLIGRNGSPSQ